jgi:hypothetical protein
VESGRIDESIHKYRITHLNHQVLAQLLRVGQAADFTGSAQPDIFEKIKAKFANRNRVRTEDAGTSPAGAVVSNPENKRGVIKAFIVPSRSV